MKTKVSFVRERWYRLPRRDRWMLALLGVFLLTVLAFSGLWQPARERLATAERVHQQRLLQARDVLRAQPVNPAMGVRQGFSSDVSKSVTAAGLELQNVDLDGELLRLTLSGNAEALLKWINQAERQGAILQALTLDKRDTQLEARVVLRGVQAG